MSRHPWYGLAQWQKKRARQLKAEPLCRYCRQEGIVRPADTADHIIPHKGNEHDFWNNDLQSLCHQCHNTTKKKEEAQGYNHRVGSDGIPIDPSHPFNQRR